MNRTRKTASAFTLAEVLVAGAVLALIVLLMTRLTNHATAVITQGTKHMETESTARGLFDRMQVDVAQMVKRTDISYYLKNGFVTQGPIMGNGNGSPGSPGVNDWLAFYSAGGGYYDTQYVKYNSGYAVVAYRVNNDDGLETYSKIPGSPSASYNRPERMGKGIALNGAYNTAPGSTNPNNSITPLQFLDGTNPSLYNTTIEKVWPTATVASANFQDYYSLDPYQAYELVGSQVFRFEYYYLTSASPSALVAYPTAGFKDPTLNWADANMTNIKDVAAIVVAVATIDPQSRKLLTNDQIKTLIQRLPDYTSTAIPNYGKPGALLAQWQTVLNGIITPTSPYFDSSMPRPAIQGVRLYERYFYLSQ